MQSLVFYGMVKGCTHHPPWTNLVALLKICYFQSVLVFQSCIVAVSVIWVPWQLNACGLVASTSDFWTEDFISCRLVPMLEKCCYPPSSCWSDWLDIWLSPKCGKNWVHQVLCWKNLTFQAVNCSLTWSCLTSLPHQSLVSFPQVQLSSIARPTQQWTPGRYSRCWNSQEAYLHL